MLEEGMPRAQIVAVLQGYAYEITRIVALIPQGSGAATLAQARLKQLKDAVHGDFKHRHAVARSAQLTSVEKANLNRAINDVYCALQAIGVNTMPSPDWRNALFVADKNIQR